MTISRLQRLLNKYARKLSDLKRTEGRIHDSPLHTKSVTNISKTWATFPSPAVYVGRLINVCQFSLFQEKLMPLTFSNKNTLSTLR